MKKNTENIVREGMQIFMCRVTCETEYLKEDIQWMHLRHSERF